MYVDANLPVLLVAGLTGRELIAKHGRLREYTVEDYELLAGLVRRAGQVFVTPNTLTEASNLLAQHGEPERSRLLATLRGLIDASSETVIGSRDASRDDAFLRLGLTDAALLTAVSPATPCGSEYRKATGRDELVTIGAGVPKTVGRAHRAPAAPLPPELGHDLRSSFTWFERPARARGILAAFADRC